MTNERYQIDRILTVYTRTIEQIASAVLCEHGFLGVEPRPDAPKTWPELQAFWNGTPSWQQPKFFPVWDGANENTVFDEKPMVNYLFRGWHDLTHCLHNQDFSEIGEYRVADAMAVQMPAGVLREILLADTKWQTAYYYQHVRAGHGKYVGNQREFVIAQVFGREFAKVPA